MNTATNLITRRRALQSLTATAFAMGMVIFLVAVNVQAQDLDLGARVQPVPQGARFSEPGYFVWCGAPVAGRGWEVSSVLFPLAGEEPKAFAPGWAIHSEIAYAVADQPFGPYKFVNVALPARGTNAATGTKYWDADVTHNPNIVLRDGKYLLYYIGNYGDGKYPTHRNHQRIGVAIADNPKARGGVLTRRSLT